jgi:hypothetical protein
LPPAGNEAPVLQRRARGLHRIERAELGDEILERPGVELRAEPGIARRQGRGAVAEEFQIETGTAGDDGRFAAALDLRDDRPCHAQVAAGVGFLRGIEHSIQVVRHPAAVLLPRRCC